MRNELKCSGLEKRKLENLKMENGQPELNMSIDEALQKLDEINAQLAKTDIELMEAMKLYQEGVWLANALKEKLVGVEKEFTIINEKLVD